jgi:hypothetical protein
LQAARRGSGSIHIGRANFSDAASIQATIFLLTPIVNYTNSMLTPFAGSNFEISSRHEDCDVRHQKYGKPIAARSGGQERIIDERSRANVQHIFATKPGKHRGTRPHAEHGTDPAQPGEIETSLNDAQSETMPVISEIRPDHSDRQPSGLIFDGHFAEIILTTRTSDT